MNALYTQRNPIALFGATLIVGVAVAFQMLQRPAPPPAAPGPVMHVSFAAPPQPLPPAPAPTPPTRAINPRIPSPTPTPQAAPSPSPVSTGAPSSTAAPTAAPTAPAPPAAPNAEMIEASYTAIVRQRIEQEKIYPTSREARIQRPSGRVRVWFVLTRDGAISDAGVEQSAGNILDRQALVTVRRGRYAPFPNEAWAGQGQRRFTVELEFIPT